MAIDRRQFLRGAVGSLTLLPLHPLAAGRQATRILSCHSDNRGNHFFSVVDDTGAVLFTTRLPARGHGIAVAPSQRHAAVFARRPGEYLWIVDLEEHRVTHRRSAAPDRHFFGHGVFTPDGRYLLCSENAYEQRRGCIGVYDAASSFRRIDEFDSHGVGPHEIRLLRDGRTLVIANGGILTHPDMPRVKLNLDSMRPNLAYLDTESSTLLRCIEPPEEWHQLSVRHIDINAGNRVAVAMQFQGRPQQRPPLIALQQGDEPMTLLKPSPDIHKRMKNYCGSVSFNDSGTVFAVSSPRGGLVTWWQSDGTYLGAHAQADACGIADAPEGNFFISDGGGDIRQFDAARQSTRRFTHAGVRWDNHLLRI